MNSHATQGMWILIGFLVAVITEAVTIIVLSYKLGVYKGRLAQYERAQTQPPAAGATT
jgi:hypothetical protein